MSHNDHVQLVVHLRGLVRGVGFRYYTSKEAERLGLVGYARNTKEGVDVVAEGTKGDVENLLSFLRHGPRAANVTYSDYHFEKASGRFTTFTIE